MPQSSGVSLEKLRELGRDHRSELQPLLVGARGQQVGDLFDRRAQVEVECFDGELSGFDLRIIEDVVDDRQEGVRAAANGLAVIALFRVQRGVEQQSGHADHAIHGRADLVAHVGQEFTLGLGRPDQLGRPLLHPLLQADIAFCQLGVGPQQSFPGAVQADGRPRDLLLHDVEAGGQITHLVRGVHGHRLIVEASMGRLQLSPAQRLHRAREVRQSAFGQPVGGAGEVLGGVGDHAGQHEAHSDRQHGDRHEDIGQGGDERGLRLRDVIDRQKIAGAIERQDHQHGARELQVQRTARRRLTGEAAIAPAAPGVER